MESAALKWWKDRQYKQYKQYKCLANSSSSTKAMLIDCWTWSLLEQSLELWTRNHGMSNLNNLSSCTLNFLMLIIKTFFTLNLRGSCNLEFSNSYSSLYRTLSLDWIPWQLKADMVACRSWSRKAGKLSRQAESCFGNRGDWKGWRNSLLYCTFFWFWGRFSWKAPQAHAHSIWASHLGIWRWINSSCFRNTDWKSWCCHLLGKSNASSSDCNVC